MEMSVNHTKTAAANDLQSSAGRSPVILTIDSDADYAELLRARFAEQGWETIATKDCEQGAVVFFENHPDLIIMDAVEGNEQSTALQAMRDHAGKAFVPLITMSGSANTDELRVCSFASGSSDFIEKSCKAEELIVRVGRLLDVRRQMTALSLVDGLTGGYNRHFFTFELERQLSDLKRTRDPFTLVLMDLDRFRDINERYGYAEGDRRLTQFGLFIRERIRSSDVLIYDESDRFILVLPKTYAGNADALIRRLLDEYAGLPNRSDASEDRSTFSAGMLEVVDGEWTGEQCVRMVTSALLEAKAEGGNALRLYIPEDGQKQGWTRHLNLAVVDDDPLVRHLLENRLKDLGGAELDVDLRSYPDGEAFLADDWHKGKGQFAIVLDRNMPRMNGMELLRRLRSKYDRARYQVLMLTAVNTEESMSRAMAAGADDYMTKPFSLVELESRILRLIKGTKR